MTITRPPLPLDGPSKPAAAAAPASADNRYEMRGLVVRVSPTRESFTVSHDAIPGVMPAMTMEFPVRRADDLRNVNAGTMVTFTLVTGADSGHAEQITVQPYETAEQDPLSARRLTLFKALSRKPKPRLALGQPVPDFTLIDQRRRPVTLSSLRGKVVAVNFIYTSCALPQFCLRTASAFGAVQRRLKGRLGKDLVLLSVTFDPGRDDPQRLAEYAAQFDADPGSWHFLTGEAAEIRRVCEFFGVEYFPDEGLMAHSLHAVVIDRKGRLAADVEGNHYTTAQLGDLLAETLAH